MRFLWLLTLLLVCGCGSGGPVAPATLTVVPTGAVGYSRQPVTFAITGLAAGGAIYAWDFGAGTNPATNSAATPAVVLARPGTYEASVTVTTAVGAPTVIPFSYTVALPPRVAWHAVRIADGPYDTKGTFFPTADRLYLTVDRDYPVDLEPRLWATLTDAPIAAEDWAAVPIPLGGIRNFHIVDDQLIVSSVDGDVAALAIARTALPLTPADWRIVPLPPMDVVLNASPYAIASISKTATTWVVVGKDYNPIVSTSIVDNPQVASDWNGWSNLHEFFSPFYLGQPRLSAASDQRVTILSAYERSVLITSKGTPSYDRDQWNYVELPSEVYPQSLRIDDHDIVFRFMDSERNRSVEGRVSVDATTYEPRVTFSPTPNDLWSWRAPDFVDGYLFEASNLQETNFIAFALVDPVIEPSDWDVITIDRMGGYGDSDTTIWHGQVLAVYPDVVSNGLRLAVSDPLPYGGFTQ
ncbi:MAG: PKD domain-containing protein [bacterium]